MFRKLLLIVLLLILSQVGNAQDEHQLIRRIAVFPVQTSKLFSGPAEETWWKMREVLTTNKRFLVASKSFLQRKDVFQSRGKLRPADVIILGELLDANTVITARFENRKFQIMAYESSFGRPIWEREVVLHPSIPVGEQLPAEGEKLIKEFMFSLPYQGYVVKDEIIGQVVYEENENLLIQMEVGVNSHIELGEKFQLIRVYSSNNKPLFDGGSTVEVFAEGVIQSNDKGRLIGKIERATSIGDIKGSTLVRLPKEANRIKELYQQTNSLRRRIDPEYFTHEMTPLVREAKETQPLVAALTFIVNLVTILLLAF